MVWRKGDQRHLLRLSAADHRFSDARRSESRVKINLDDLISRIYRFDEINEGFALLLAGEVARGVIVFD
jgi:Zn-dependent alcohol dehydrogenase